MYEASIHNIHMAPPSSMCSTLSFCELPSEVLAAVLSHFCDGKTISTFLLTGLSNRTLKKKVLSLCRGALVQRYIALAARIVQDDDEIRDVLNVLREEIRLSSDDTIDDLLVTKFSEWCAVLDYFETQLAVTAHYRRPHYIVWSGRIEIQYGMIDAYLSTPYWTVGALRYWRALELASLTLTHPRNANFTFTAESRIPYASLFARNGNDKRRMHIQSSDLEVSVFHNDVNAQRHALVPLHDSYNPEQTVVFVDHSFVSRTHEAVPVGPLLIAKAGRESLCCCWDKENGEDDWEEAVASLGEHVIRIMNSFSQDGRSFRERLLDENLGLAEFSNFG